MFEKNNVESIISKEMCSGCMACASICHVEAITFSNKMGFRYPNIDEIKCVNCGLCVKKCPAINSAVNKNTRGNVEVFSAWTKNHTQRRNSTSGGICFELSKYILENGGCVAGVAWINNYRDAEYVLIDSIEDLPAITQTKYFQPQMNNIYAKVKEKLVQGVQVLFIGSACSIEGLRLFLTEDYENLICCDFICRGYTSQIFHEKRIDYLEKKTGSRIVGVQYKNKDKGWTNFGTKFQFENGSEYYVNRYDDPYEIMFKVDDLNTRPSCYECKYRTMPRTSDITVGDFWTIKGVSDEDLKYGVSAVFVFNNKGKDLLDRISDRIEYQHRTVEEVSAGNYALLHQIRQPQISPNKFFEDLEISSFDEIEKKYASKKVIKMRRFKSLLANLSKCNLFTFLKLNFFTKGIVRKRHKFLFPYYGSRIEIQPGAKLIINENLIMNRPKHKYSNEQAYLRIMKGGTFEVNGFSSLAANSTIEILPDAELKIGNIETNYGATIICSNKIIIGNGVDIGRNAMIYDSNFHPTSLNKKVKLKPLIIKDHVWICSGVTITKGIIIEEGAVCGINSTVSRNVKSKHLVMGNPAKSVMANIEW